MDKMFKDIYYVLEINMTSNKSCKILSMISAFENCANLNSLKIEDFNTTEVKSLERLFYQTPILTYTFKNFNTENVLDMSYMFYSSGIEHPDLSFLNTNVLYVC